MIDMLQTVRPEIDALTAALSENGQELPVNACTTVRVHDLLMVLGALETVSRLLIVLGEGAADA